MTGPLDPETGEPDPLLPADADPDAERHTNGTTPPADADAAPADPDTAAPDLSAPPAPPDADAPLLDRDGQPRLTLFGLTGRAVPAVYLVGWIASAAGAGVVLVSMMGARNPFAPWLFLVGLVVLAIGLMAAAGSQTVERSRRASSPFRGPSPVLAFGVVIAVGLIGVVAVVAPLSALGLDASGPLATTISLAVTLAVYLLVVRTLVVATGALSWAEIGFSRPLRPALGDLLSGAVLAVPVLIATMFLAALLAAVLPAPQSPLPPSTTVDALLLNLLSAAVIAPFGEEVFFRGYTTTAWARAVGPRAAVLRGAVFFAFAHIVTLFSSSFGTGAPAALAQFVDLLPAGLALGWVFLSRRSIWASIGLHGAFNGLQLLLLFAVTTHG